MSKRHGMTADQVLAMQTDLHQRASSDEMFREMIRAQSILMHGSGRLDENVSGGYDKRNADIMVDALARHVQAAEAYRVTGDMCMLVEQAAAQLTDEDLFDPSLAPTGCGIVRFEKPIKMIEVRGRTMLIHWIVWGPIGLHVQESGADYNGTVITCWNDHNEPDDITRELAAQFGWPYLNEIHGRWGLASINVFRVGAPINSAMIEPDRETAEAVAKDGDTPHAFTNMIRVLHALWLMLNQTIAVVEPEHVRRTGAGIARQKGLPARVNVVRLRRIERPARPPDGENIVHWSHRWFVRGHWRWQVCSQQYPGAQITHKGWRARIWISPFVKGPDDAPLVQAAHVYDLRR